MDSRPATRAQLLAGALGLVAAGSLAMLGGVLVLGGCASDEPVGHSSTTEKRTIDTPTERTTVTETHDKDTRYVPR
jgi:hypothetical protein